MTKHYTARKYMGDDQGSWAVFRKADIKGLPKGIVVSERVTPIVCGCTRNEAEYYCKTFEKEKPNG